MSEKLRWTASDTAIRPRFDLTRDGVAIDLTNASRVSVQLSKVVASGVTALSASYLATVASGMAVTDGKIEVLTYSASPLATAGVWRSQVTITSAGGVETLDSPYTILIRSRY